MKLRSVSRSFFAAVLLALIANVGFLLAIRQAEVAVREAFDARDRTLSLVDELVSEDDLLAQLVQSFTTTGETRYLTIYYDILAVRDGEKPAPQGVDLALYWREVVAGRRSGSKQPSTGSPRSLIDRMQQLAFSQAELADARKVLECATALQSIEKVAFAATQGLYDGRTEQFVSDGKPDLALAVRLVHSPQYEHRRADLVAAVSRLHDDTRART